METETPAPPRLSGTALIVEDNLIIAMAAEVILLELGARHVETAASSQPGADVDRSRKPDFALLDLNLGNENSIPVAARLTETEGPLHVRAPAMASARHVPAELDSPHASCRNRIPARSSKRRSAGCGEAIAGEGLTSNT